MISLKGFPSNPALLCATYLYKYIKEANTYCIPIQDITGIAVSTLKNAYKKEFKCNKHTYQMENKERILF